MSKSIYIWEFPVRLTHWLNVLSIITLAFTGFYIGAPFIHAVTEDELIMSTMRFIHFVAAYVFSVSVLVRIYWWFAGNKYAKYDQFVPTTDERVKNAVDTGLFYAFLKKEIPHAPGHTGLAGIAYTFLFFLFIVEILTGFALYSMAHGGGALWTLLGGWTLAIFTAGTIRLFHHVIMWLIVIFVIAHVYISWHNDLFEKNGLMSSIFSGYKHMEDKD
jgi:Ni/Fe-hydrogenase 1 B-type cytochrome subunit